MKRFHPKLRKLTEKLSHPEGILGSVVILVSSVPGSDRTLSPQTLSEQINEKEDVFLQLHPFLPELDHQSPQDVPGTAQVHH